MVTTEVIVSIISGASAVFAAGVGFIINKYTSIIPSLPPENYQGEDYCQIQETPILRFAGYPIFCKSNCDNNLSECPNCNKNLCQYHIPPTKNYKLCYRYSCHICENNVNCWIAEP